MSRYFNRRRYFSFKINFDIFDDYWLWLQSTEPLTEQIEWTDKDIEELCDRLLEESIRSLFDSRSSEATVSEILFWITNAHDKNPFSFHNCCLVSGFKPEVFRDAIIDRFQRTRRHFCSVLF
ncbi:MAG: hypothetical protein Q7U57_07045 [Methylovulum sp.]|nr:hypothetical protein [Methylovulum sp.]